MIPDRYNTQNIRKVYTDPSLLFDEFKKIRKTIGRNLYNLYMGNDYRKKGSKISNEDWDNLIILDACRYDVFEEVYDIPGSLEHRFSLGSSSPEFIKNNFLNEDFNDTIYITTNPYVSILEGNEFYDVIFLNEDWDSQLGTVHPKHVVEKTKKINDMYRDKKLIIHFMQPHHPFLSDDGLILREGGWSPKNKNRSSPHIWTLLESGEVEKDQVWNAYKENLKFVLDYVLDLEQELVGKTVISSDHGNMFGKRISPMSEGIYAHPSGLYTPELIKVPWFIFQSEGRKNVTEEEPVNSASNKVSSRKEKLQALGYIEK